MLGSRQFNGRPEWFYTFSPAHDFVHANPPNKQPAPGPIAKDSRLFGRALREHDTAGNALNWTTDGVQFVANTTRGTHKHIGCDTAVYLYDQHPNPQIALFLGLPSGSKEEREFSDAYALSEFVQWLFRSKIRRGGLNGTGNAPTARGKATVYVPSARMRNLLINWLATGKVSSVVPDGPNSSRPVLRVAQQGWGPFSPG
jgi:hypothetical protein